MASGDCDRSPIRAATVGYIGQTFVSVYCDYWRMAQADASAQHLLPKGASADGDGEVEEKRNLAPLNESKVSLSAVKSPAESKNCGAALSGEYPQKTVISQKEQEMNIVIATNPATVPKGAVTVVMGDQGGAFVSIRLSIPNVGRVEFEDTYSGFLTKTIDIPRGTYVCTVVISAYRTGALGPTYNSAIQIGGNLIASARGSIPNGKDSEHAFASFTLIAS